MLSSGIPGCTVITSVTLNGRAITACKHLVSVCSHFAPLSPIPIVLLSCSIKVPGNPILYILYVGNFDSPLLLALIVIRMITVSYYGLFVCSLYVYHYSAALLTTGFEFWQDIENPFRWCNSINKNCIISLHRYIHATPALPPSPPAGVSQSK